MRVHEPQPIDPQIAATLDAIDATLAGEPVDGRYAELAEIALLLRAVRPEASPQFAQSLDERVGRRFASADAPPPGTGPGARARWIRFGEWTGALVAGVAAIVAIVVLVGHGQGAPSVSSSSASVSAARPPAIGASSGESGASAATSSSAGASGRIGAPGHAPASKAPALKSSGAGSSGSLSAATGSTAAGAPSRPAAPATTAVPPNLTPPTTGRQVVQSAQLELGAAPNRIDDVAQQVYNVVGQINGIVESSTVTQTGSADGYASFQLSVPSGSLGQTMTRLSTLNDAEVLSRTDATQDITDQYNATVRSLADARALRTSLLKQLANAVTTEEIDSLTAQIHDAEASISSDQATLNRLNHQVNFSQLALTISAQPTPVPVKHGSGGFTIRRAAHDAGRMLTVTAGVALIAIAALTPVALLVALAWWVGAALRRRRREQALDSA